MKNRFKKIAIICIAFIGISLVATAAVNMIFPNARIVSATNNENGEVRLDVKYINSTSLKLYECTAEGNIYYMEVAVGFSGEEEDCEITISGLAPGLHTFMIRAVNSIDQTDKDSKPINVYVNEL